MKKTLEFVVLLMAFPAVFALIQGSAEGALIVEDGTFDDWTFESVQYLNGNSIAAFLPDGSPERIGVSFAIAHGPMIGVALLRPNGPAGIAGTPLSIDPKALGGISSIDFSIDYSNVESAFNGHIVFVYIQQDGNAYLATHGASGIRMQTGASGSGTLSDRFTSSNFRSLADPDDVVSYSDDYFVPEKPDFSSTGGTIRVGFAASVSTPVFFDSSDPSFFQVAYDNFRFSLEHPLGKSQFDPILPGNVTDDGSYVFENIPSGQWFDPPVSDFLFETLDGSLFTSILDFPTGFDERFDVFVGDNLLGKYGPGDTVDFGSGVSNFSIRGISPTVDSEDPAGFPIKLEFDREIASFQMTPVVPVPEPHSLTLLVVGLSAIFAIRVWQSSTANC